MFDNLSRARLQMGINKVADAVGVTLGPRGAMLGSPNYSSTLWVQEFIAGRIV